MCCHSLFLVTTIVLIDQSSESFSSYHHYAFILRGILFIIFVLVVNNEMPILPLTIPLFSLKPLRWMHCLQTRSGWVIEASEMCKLFNCWIIFHFNYIINFLELGDIMIKLKNILLILLFEVRYSGHGFHEYTAQSIKIYFQKGSSK